MKLDIAKARKRLEWLKKYQKSVEHDRAQMADEKRVMDLCAYEDLPAALEVIKELLALLRKTSEEISDCEISNGGLNVVPLHEELVDEIEELVAKTESSTPPERIVPYIREVHFVGDGWKTDFSSCNFFSWKHEDGRSLTVGKYGRPAMKMYAARNETMLAPLIFEKAYSKEMGKHLSDDEILAWVRTVLEDLDDVLPG